MIILTKKITFQFFFINQILQSFSMTTANYKPSVHTCPYLHWPGEGDLSTLSFSQCGSPYYPHSCQVHIILQNKAIHDLF